MQYRLLLFFLCILLSGCVQQTKRAHVHLQDIEAKYDIPFPLGSRIISSDVDGSRGFLHVKIPLMREEVIDFYETEMERLGWRLGAVTKSDKIFYYWRKPHRWCSLVFTPTGSFTLEDLFIGF